MVMAVVMSRHFGLLTSDFIARETTIDVRRSEARMLEFPAVTICNANPIKKSALESLAGGNPLLQQLLDLDDSGASNRRRRKSEYFHILSMGLIEKTLYVCDYVKRSAAGKVDYCVHI